MKYEILRDLGFTEREEKVYIALLELGSSTAGPIASRSGLQYTKVYESLDRLIGKGLVSFVVVSKTKHFQAAPPKDILLIIDQKKKEFMTILDELELKHKMNSNRQIAVVHEGYKGVKRRFESLADELGKGDYCYAFAFRNEYRMVSPTIFMRNIHRILAEKKVDDRIIAPKGIINSIEKTYGGIPGIKIKYTTDSNPFGMIITPGKIFNNVWGNRPTSIEITSEAINQQYKDFFEEKWKKT